MIDVEKLETKFGLEISAKKTINSLHSTIEVKRKIVDYCFKYLKKCKLEKDFDIALYVAAKEFDFLKDGFDYNIFNGTIFKCIFYSLVGNNVSRIDNMEELILTLFPNELKSYDTKEFSFQKLCLNFPNKKITLILQKIIDDHGRYKKIRKLRDQIEHSAIGNILINDPALHEKDDCFVNSDYTLSGKQETLVDFAKSLNELLYKIEEQTFNCLLTHGKDCLK